MPPERGPLIAAAELARLLGEPGLVVLDATYFLPHEGQDARAACVAAHIPGARFFDIDAFGDPDTDLPHMVPAAGRFARLAESLGISNESQVVAYDQRGIFSAGRAWWLLRLFGHRDVAVVDGGLPAWNEEGFPVESGAVPPPPARFRPLLTTSHWRGLGDVLANVSTGAEILLDARSSARFHAAEAERRPGVRSGHVPGARSLPFTELLGPDRRLLPRDALRAAFAARGVDGSRPVVAMCGSGVTATVLSLAMAKAGLPEAAVYDGSWTEWGSRPELPLET